MSLSGCALIETGYNLFKINNENVRIPYKMYAFQIGVFDRIIDVVFVKRIPDKKTQEILKKSLDRTEGGFTNAQNNTITIRIIEGLTGRADLMSTIQHEINHLYQSIKQTQSHIVPNNNDQHEQQYAIFVRKLNSPHPIEKAIAVVVYLTMRTEQDSFANQEYVSLGLGGKPVGSQMYKELCEALELLKTNKRRTIKILNRILENSNISLRYNNLIRWGECAKTRFKKKLNLVHAKYFVKKQ